MTYDICMMLCIFISLGLICYCLFEMVRSEGLLVVDGFGVSNQACRFKGLCW